jgi:hypothetical protein
MSLGLRGVRFLSRRVFLRIVSSRKGCRGLIGVGRDGDERGVLDGLDGMFDSLVRRFGVERAVKTLVGVIFEDE